MSLRDFKADVFIAINLAKLNQLVIAIADKITRASSEPLDWETVVAHALSIKEAERVAHYGKPARKVNGRAFISTGREIGSFALHIDGETKQLMIDNNSKTY